jgi:cold shock protein
MTVMVGRVVRFDRAKGYGFVAPRDGTEDVFLHVHDLLDDEQLIRPGAVVEFDVGEGDRGLKAFDVRIVRSDGPTPGSGAPSPAPPTPAGGADSDGLCEVVRRAEFSREVTRWPLRQVAPQPAAVPHVTPLDGTAPSRHALSKVERVQRQA